eukprot:Em0019g100a
MPICMGLGLEQVQGHVSSLLLTLTALVTAIADQLAKVACDSSSNGVVTMVADIMNKWVQEAQEKNEKLKDEIHSQSECPEMQEEYRCCHGDWGDSITLAMSEENREELAQVLNAEIRIRQMMDSTKGSLLKYSHQALSFECQEMGKKVEAMGTRIQADVDTRLHTLRSFVLRSVVRLWVSDGLMDHHSSGSTGLAELERQMEANSRLLQEMVFAMKSFHGTLMEQMEKEAREVRIMHTAGCAFGHKCSAERVKSNCSKRKEIFHFAATESVDTRNESISSDDEDAANIRVNWGNPYPPLHCRSVRWQSLGDPEETQGTFTSAAPTPVSQRRILMETPDPAICPVAMDIVHSSVAKTCSGDQKCGKGPEGSGDQKCEKGPEGSGDQKCVKGPEGSGDQKCGKGPEIVKGPEGVKQPEGSGDQKCVKGPEGSGDQKCVKGPEGSGDQKCVKHEQLWSSNTRNGTPLVGGAGGRGHGNQTRVDLPSTH